MLNMMPVGRTGLSRNFQKIVLGRALWAERPRVARWLAAVRARPSFELAISRVLTDVDRERLTVSPAESRRLFG